MPSAPPNRCTIKKQQRGWAASRNGTIPIYAMAPASFITEGIKDVE